MLGHTGVMDAKDCKVWSTLCPYAGYSYGLCTNKAGTPMQVIACKVQRAPIEKRMPDGSVQTFFAKIGAYMELNDGHKIACPDGKTRIGTGTIVRYNYKHDTWSVQPPARGVLTRMGYEFTRNGPGWELPMRIRGMSTTEFKRQYSKQLVNLCYTHMTLEY